MRWANVIKIVFFGIWRPWEWKGHEECTRCLSWVSSAGLYSVLGIYTWNRESVAVTQRKMEDVTILLKRAASSQQAYLQIGSIRSWMFSVLITVSSNVQNFARRQRERVEMLGKSAPWLSSRKSRNGECDTSCHIIRPANPSHSSTGGMILGIWNAVRRARWNQIKTKLRSVRLRAHNLLLSMNFDRYKGNKRRRNRGRKWERGRYCVLDECCSFRQPGSRFWKKKRERKKLLPWGRKKEL